MTSDFFKGWKKWKNKLKFFTDSFKMKAIHMQARLFFNLGKLPMYPIL